MKKNNNKEAIIYGIIGGSFTTMYLYGMPIINILFFAFILFSLKTFSDKISMLEGNGAKNKGSIPEVTFDEVGGQNSAKRELKETLDLLINKEKTKELGIRPLKGLLLAGPPGTGKTLFAKASANYTNSVFISRTGSDFVEQYVGTGAKRIRKMFEKAEEKAKEEDKDSAVIFIDELDALGNRDKRSGTVEHDQTINQLLSEIDGLEKRELDILVIGSTNREESLDKALLRSGRFDRKVRVDLPDKEGRREILEIHTADKPLSNKVDLNKLAKQTFRFSGADLENVINEGAIFAMRDNDDKIKMKHLNEAIDKVQLGGKSDKEPKDNELKRVAYHEVGHALISELNQPNSVNNITITSRGKALGYVSNNPEEDYYLRTLEELEEEIEVLVAGRASEEVMLGNKSTGATNDLMKATKKAKMIINSGLSELGIISKEDLPKEETNNTINKIIHNQEDKAKEKIKEHKDFINDIVQKLLEKEKITGESFRNKLGEFKEVLKVRKDYAV